jgi:hypothetical protein
MKSIYPVNSEQSVKDILQYKTSTTPVRQRDSTLHVDTFYAQIKRRIMNTNKPSNDSTFTLPCTHGIE